MGWGGGGHVNVSCTSYIIVCYAAEISGIVATLLVTTLQRFLVLLLRDIILRDGEKAENAPQILQGFQHQKSTRHCGKITLFGQNVHTDEHGFRSGGLFLQIEHRGDRSLTKAGWLMSGAIVPCIYRWVLF